MPCRPSPRRCRIRPQRLHRLSLVFSSAANITMCRAFSGPCCPAGWPPRRCYRNSTIRSDRRWHDGFTILKPCRRNQVPRFRSGSVAGQQAHQPSDAEIFRSHMRPPEEPRELIHAQHYLHQGLYSRSGPFRAQCGILKPDR